MHPKKKKSNFTTKLHSYNYFFSTSSPFQEITHSNRMKIFWQNSRHNILIIFLIANNLSLQPSHNFSHVLDELSILIQLCTFNNFILQFRISTNSQINQEILSHNTNTHEHNHKPNSKNISIHQIQVQPTVLFFQHQLKKLICKLALKKKSIFYMLHQKSTSALVTMKQLILESQDFMLVKILQLQNCYIRYRITDKKIC
eukprot:TRINITY_DN1196_c1_g1_i3.p1 TRINITY_DN1196_c1_g1~~TRINITY_DN1196_c1_g1_i3.p1  ORF type:complete len:200 (-),score=-24.41 TRINITY_DN1196_c1_g1_i3:368-967(-)